ncbi:hypothetical protein GGS23DRAFT_426057 [Durotheca rogersii]|uniref:uncharacterized protein n=1 Tax=Durotheca rogersii TaxID=419775 RepID=UPI00221F88C4|nr:uncharacterized protein GGS23DRAFT_426057 [Durotheca rogersii]KAI5865413.1 hypothetical protein GGS23DRAFT_426057 [Durotheca rogersii]
MSNQVDFEYDASAREYGDPHSAQHPIPTVQGYRQRRKELAGQLRDEEEAQQGPEELAKPKRPFESVKAIIQGKDSPTSRHDPYPSANRNYANDPRGSPTSEKRTDDRIDDSRHESPTGGRTGQGVAGPGRASYEMDKGRDKSATEAVVSAVDPKEKRKVMKRTSRHGEGRRVTDPVTHLPIIIHDQTDSDLSSVSQNELELGVCSDASRSDEEMRLERKKLQRTYNGMQRVFPPPDFKHTRQQLANIYQQTVCTGLGIIAFLAAILLRLPTPFFGSSRSGSLFPQWYTIFSTAVFIPLAVVTAMGMGKWIHKKVSELFDDETWDAARREEQAALNDDEELPESVQWLNSLFAAVWPLVNPDLFASLVDRIEDVMQASLPKVIRMVSVDDMGQGSESLRILGIRWLPTGAASQSIGAGGQPQGDDEGAGDAGGDADADEDALRGGMEAEEGDFVNLELALAYRGRSSGKSLKMKAKNAHLYLKFYLPGEVAIPVWVELRGLIITLRLRLQLTPDPPFISLCTMTFLGQPKASISCTPLSKRSFSLTDVPLISSFVNSAIDAALAEYVAPKSLTLNLRDMLVGSDFKKNTISLGTVWIFIKSARGFKQGDGGVGPVKGSSDAYVTVSWGKFGKPMASTRIITNGNEPNWNEYTSILVTPEEVNAEEKLRLQLWDSDRWSADDDLGRVEVDLKYLMGHSRTYNKVEEREDGFSGQDPDEKMPGSLVWSVGYFSKTRITPEQFEQQTINKEVRSKEQLQEHVSVLAERKLRESGKSSDDEEIKQQKAQDYNELEESMIASAPPSSEFVSGILGVQIHNIIGLEIQNPQKQDQRADSDDESEAEQDDNMPDGYCTIILNQKKIYRTRTKPKNSKPFFNAGTERFVRDWRDAEIIVSVRDSREREEDPLIGLVYLPLAKLLAKRSQVMDTYPLVGGIGYGRVRISLVWRSVEITLPPSLRGWNYGTLEVRGAVKTKGALPESLTEHRVKIRTNLGRVKMYPRNGQWAPKHQVDEAIFLAVHKRYSSAVVFEFRESFLGSDRTTAFAVLWLQDLVDEKNEVKTLKVWKGSKDDARKARSSCDYNSTGEGDHFLGEIEVELKFWRGLSGYHKGYASKANNTDLRNVMECLDTITDEKLDDSDDGFGEDADTTGDEDSEDETRRKKLRVHTNDSSSDSSDDEGARGASGSATTSKVSLSDFKKIKNIFRNPADGVTEAATAALAPGHNDPDDGSRGVRNQLRDYKDHHKQLHRKHRGIMQWRPAREANHLGGKLSRLKGNISEIFHHSEKDADIETEV